MRIQKQTSSQLILSGIPGSLGWMLTLTFFGLLLITTSLLMGAKVWNESMSPYLLLPLGVGALFGVGFIWIGISQLKERERLILDKTRRTGHYATTTPYLFTEVSIQFGWDQIVSIDLEKLPVLQATELSGLQPNATPSRVQVALKLKDTAKIILLDDEPNGSAAPINQTAQAISDFLQIPLKKSHA